MSIAALVTSPYQRVFIENMARVDRLRAVAQGDALDEATAKELGLSENGIKFTRTLSGAGVIGKWLLAFGPSLTALDEFRAAEFKGGRRLPNEDDLRLVAKASSDALEVLVRRLNDLANR